MTRLVRPDPPTLRLLGALMATLLAPLPVRAAPPPAGGTAVATATAPLMLDAAAVAGARLDGRERRFRVPLDGGGARPS